MAGLSIVPDLNFKGKKPLFISTDKDIHFNIL